jgi:hypothetical protein
VFESLFRNFQPRETPYATQRVGSQRVGGGASVRGLGAESVRVRPALPTSPTPPSALLKPMPSETVIGSIKTLTEGAGSGAGSMQADMSRTQKLTGITLSERERVHPHPCLGCPLEEV